MPSVAENSRYWDGGYDWSRLGDEWSRDWGTAAMQWHVTLLPRICRFLPTGTILEIGCGCGRWSGHLAGHADLVEAQDLSSECVQACRQRFAEVPNLRFTQGDGVSLPNIASGAVDFVFSFDSLPLVDEGVMEAYLREIRRVLRPDGAAFLHHSNLGAYRRRLAVSATFPRIAGVLKRVGWLERDLHWRDPTVSADGVARAAARQGLACISQELILWGTRRIMHDAITVLVNVPARAGRPYRVLRNRWFMEETRHARRLASLYTDGSGIAG